MSETKDLRTIHFSCACKLTTGSFQIPSHQLPLSLTLCHCWTCRHQSGLLCITNASLPHGTAFHVKGPLVEYKASEDLARIFCGNCGANVIEEDKEGKKELCAGLIEYGGGDSLVRLDQHIYVGDTKDGGARDWIPEVEAWAEFSDTSKKLEEGWKDDSLKKAGSASSSKEGRKEELQAYCRCKGVSFKITRPNESSADLNAPRGDIVGGAKSPPPTTQKEKLDRAWWLRQNGTKYLGGTCACSDCRLASGFDIQTWAFVPLANILQLDGKPFDLDDAGTLKRYHSSEGVYRDFCGTCGATVFFRSDKRPGLIDVSAGLLDAEEGTRAEDWLEWETGRVSYGAEAQNKDLIARLGAGLKRWGEEKGK